MARVLVVDDDHQIRRLLCRALTEEGHSVSLASTGDEGLDRFANVMPDVLILDLLMPRRDGFSVLRALEDLLTITQTRVVVLTGHGSEEHRKRAFELGAHDYVAKPFSTEDLCETVAQQTSAISR